MANVTQLGAKTRDAVPEIETFYGLAGAFSRVKRMSDADAFDQLAQFEIVLWSGQEDGIEWHVGITMDHQFVAVERHIMGPAMMHSEMESIAKIPYLLRIELTRLIGLSFMGDAVLEFAIAPLAHG